MGNTHTDDSDHQCNHHHNNGIYLISPSGWVHEPSQLYHARDYLTSIGFPTVIGVHALAKHERFAGTDQQRLHAIHESLNQPENIVMATRGGYGLSRILHNINWHSIANSGKLFVGHSDFTAFNLALLAQTGAISYMGPCAAFDFGTSNIDELTADLFAEAMRNELEILSFESPDSDPIDARGVLWGGTLSMVASLVGTPYMPKVDGGILFLEDVAEHPYRIERMLIQLWHANILNQQKAIVLGHFTNYRLGNTDNGYNLQSVVSWLRNTVKIPVITGLPYGHVLTKATLPVGKQIGIATENNMAYMVLNEH